MKKTVSLLLVIVALSTCLLSCKKNYDKEAEIAFEDIRAEWERSYAETSVEAKDYIQIVYTQISKVKDGCEVEMFKDIDLIIEFTIMSDLYGHGGDYLSNMHMENTVVFYKDGSHEVLAISPLRAYTAQAYDYSYDDIIEVVYQGDKYNTSLNIAGKSK